MPPPSSESDGASAESSGDIAVLRTAPGVASELPRRPASAVASASPSSSSMASMVTS